MAEKRMFMKSVIDSDDFLDMPLSTQALYFHLSMRADDDGFVNNPKRIQRTISASEDDLKLLIAKRYLLCFESGVIVIRHWRMHNTLKKDRYTPTQYQEELALLDIKDTKEYTEKYFGTSLEPTRNQNGTRMEPQYSKDKISIGKISKTYVSSDAETTVSDKPKLDVFEERFERFWSAYPKKIGKGDARKKFLKLKPNQQLFDQIMAALSAAKKTEQWTKSNGQFVPNPATWLNQSRWEDDYSGSTATNSASLDYGEENEYMPF